MIPPRVFISYSHDSAEHKRWVLDFATTLRSRGVDAVLDQWDLKPGDDLPHFMETQLDAADFVVMVCTKRYVDKANAGEGGVGYEKMIMTSSLLSRIGSNKVIPIVRQVGTDSRPTFLRSKIYINFSNDTEIEYSLDDLLRTILNAPLYEKPKIGDNPFKPMLNSRPDRTSDGVREVMRVIADCYDETEFKYIKFRKLMESVSMRRLTLDKYLYDAESQGLLTRDAQRNVYITQGGIDYLVDRNMIDV